MAKFMTTGKVIRFDEVRGYGFVTPDTGADDVFLHVNDLTFDKRLLTPGTRVQFVAAEGDRGLKATQVQIIEQGPVGPTGRTVKPATATAEGRSEDDELCDILPSAELRAEITEALVTSIPTLTATQIVGARECVLRIAELHGWTED
ncbi:cold-shock protein [Mangrovihabitans endophyticus]|uniref:cold-shock protein n=1 Tax=Mangrovihabitans endophyticus TaxID=1751298 RepID=UPI001E459EF2|nr:cold shock domain-containing protein [Mangrovihabitans endophyticus]